MVEPPSSTDVSSTLAWVHASKATNLGAMLERQWQQMHQVVADSAGPQPPAPNPAARSSECCSAGMCLCTGAGLKVRQIADAFLRHMKTTFPKDTDFRRKLLDANIVVRIVGEPLVDDNEQIVGMENAFGEVFFHVGLQYLSPFRPTFLKVEEVEHDREHAGTDGRRYIKAPHADCLGMGTSCAELFHDLSQTLW